MCDTAVVLPLRNVDATGRAYWLDGNVDVNYFAWTVRPEPVPR